MATRDAEFSDGSDIEADNDDVGEKNEGNGDVLGGIDREVQHGDVDDWILDIFDEDSGDEGEFLGFQNRWVTEDFTGRVRPRYKKVGGSTIEHPEEASAGQYFELIWTDEMWDKLVQETNTYAEQERTKNPPPPYAPKWTPVTKADLKAFIGLCFAMGIMRFPTKNDYWRQSKWMLTTQFGRVMPRDRFTQIWRYLHLQNNEQQPEQPDKLWKIRWFIEFLNTKFKELYVPHENVTIDESMIKFKGRLAFRQYLPAKPIKWGVKIWTMAESDTGYMNTFQIYTGKENNTEKGLAHRVVMDLCTHMFGTNLNVYMDNFYTSPQLLQDLHVRGILACGTVRSNRKGLPKELLPARINLEKHAYKVAQNDSLTFCVWKDTKPVLVLSNFHDPQHTGQVTRRAAAETIVEVPRLLSDYQKYMKGVDLCDQMIGYYMLHHRSKKWWRRIFFYLMMVSAHNAYVIAKDTHPEMSKDRWPIFQDFVEEIFENLIGDTRSGREAPKVDCGGRATEHSIKKLYEKNKVCRECSLSGTPGQRKGVTKFGCTQCNVPVHLECQSNHIMRMIRQ